MIGIKHTVDVSHRFQPGPEWKGDDLIATTAFIAAIQEGKTDDEAGEIYLRIMQSRRAEHDRVRLPNAPQVTYRYPAR